MKKMNVLIIASLIAILVVYAIIIAIVIAWEFLPIDRTPSWLDDLYYFITRN